MATFTAARAAASFPVFHPDGTGDMCVAFGTINITANPTANDIYQMCRVPRNATVVGGLVYGADLDTGTESLDMDIGWAANGVDVADPDGFGNFGVWTGAAITGFKPVAGIYFPFQGVLLTGGPVTFGAETIIQLVCNVTAATGGTGQLSVNVYYTVY